MSGSISASAQLATSTVRRSIVASLVIERKLFLVFNGHFFFCHEHGMEEGSALHQCSHFGGGNQLVPSLCCLSRACCHHQEERHGLLGCHIRDLIGFQRSVHFVSHESGVEEWPAFHQHSHFLTRTSVAISASAQPSLLQPTISRLVASLVV